uniref:Uncharacterized protein n=1 Tax=Arundo donax TaxID=35708 RepID=A0A0A9DG41_ARUDO
MLGLVSGSETPETMLGAAPPAASQEQLLLRISCSCCSQHTIFLPTQTMICLLNSSPRTRLPSLTQSRRRRLRPPLRACRAATAASGRPAARRARRGAYARSGTPRCRRACPPCT